MAVKTKSKRLLSLMLAICMALTVLPMSVFASATEDYKTIYFGFNTLTDDNLRGAYNTLCDGVSAKSESIDLSAYSLTLDQLEKVIELYRYDHTEHYWFPNSYTYSHNGGRIIKLQITNLTGFDDAVFEAEANKLLMAANGKTTDYDKALALHDALVKHIVYDLDAVEDSSKNQNAFNAYGAIVNGKAVCEGYAEAYQYLLQKVGIQSYIVSGSSKEQQHEWNLVRLDGKYYYTDVTWDDPITESEDENKPIYYPYFNITTARLTEDHMITDTYGILPICTDESLMYKGYAKLDSFTVDSVAALFNQQIGSQKIVRIYVTGSLEEFQTQLGNNFNAVGLKAGLISAIGSFVGREIYLVGEAIPVSATSVKLNRATISLKATESAKLTATVLPSNTTDAVKWTSDKPSVASVDDKGNITAHKSGTATIIATAGTVSAACTVYVSCEHIWSVTYLKENADADKHYHICTACGTKDAGEAHIYDDETDTICNVCGYDKTASVVDWAISTEKTGVYAVTPKTEIDGFKTDDIAVFDKNNKEIKYNTEKGGWPLVKGEAYTVKLNDIADNSKYSGVVWQLNPMADTIFPDTTADGWYNDAVNYAVGAGIMTGYKSNGLFGTSDSIQRQDFIVMLARYDGVDLSTYASTENKFPDVDNNGYYADAVKWGSENGIITGYTHNGHFGVGDTITREQLVTMLYRYAKYKGKDVNVASDAEETAINKFNDYSKVSGFSKDAVLWATEKGVITGKGVNKDAIDPQGNAQRCEVAQIMYNIFKNNIL